MKKNIIQVKNENTVPKNTKKAYSPTIPSNNLGEFNIAQLFSKVLTQKKIKGATKTLVSQTFRL
ncbi:hypothetical protein FPZ42_18075 [Mucilaginibacter achroorhodeus]|uniref:Uncharacterized protein n=1 Tax=Mucilaginibacter achroorhodeus TaxID=2599294 RepID=A0A563TX37_9SPHI|nr:hypothetical protein [Mucilaginibacter achroorhodeus]TWR23915.1 hypothetical protein FPZ42_18075 [Mucilaginibacter achroorhodeus]